MESDFVLEYFTESTNIRFLYDPKSYYNQLCSMLKNAKEKIVISCLYIGTLPLEQDFVNNIIYAKKNNPDLIVELLLDKNRSLRRENTGNCILDLIKPLLMLKNVKIYLYHSPLCDALLNRVLIPPYSEVLGTLHMKVYVADSVTVISGANCSTPYFTTRMDRYMIIDDLLFSNLMHTVISTLSTMAFKATASMGFEWVSDLVNPLDDYLLFKKQIYHRLLAMIKLCNEALEPILMEKVENIKELESKRSRSFRFLNKLTRKKSNSNRSESSYGLNLSNSISATNSLLNGSRYPETARSESFNQLESDGSAEMSVKGLKPNGTNGNSLNSSRSVNSNGSFTSSNEGSMANYNDGDYGTLLDLSNEIQKSPESIVRHSLSGNYLLTPHIYSSRYNNMKGSYISRLGSIKYSTSSTGRNTVSSEYCQACENYNSARLKGVKSANGQGNSTCEHHEGKEVEEGIGMRFDDLDYKPHKISRKYPPMDGYTRFMILFQLGFSDPPFRQDEVLCKDLMIKYRNAGHSIVLATSYLNFTDDYSNLCSYLLNCNASKSGSFYVVTSSPTSNDFNNCTDKKRLIPRLYCQYQSMMLDYVLKMAAKMSTRGENKIENKFYYEYQNTGYTFHHKGVWMFHGDIPENPKNMTFSEFKQRINGPCTMLIGSSNISRRSQSKDLEMTLVVETSSVNVLDQIKFEVYDLFKNSTCVSKDTVSKRSHWFFRIAAFLLRQYF